MRVRPTEDLIYTKTINVCPFGAFSCLICLTFTQVIFEPDMSRYQLLLGLRNPNLHLRLPIQ